MTKRSGLLAVFLLVSACASKPLPPVVDALSNTTVAARSANSGVMANPPLKAAGLNPISIDRFYSYWRGAPYRLGGNSRKGIDCSAFVRQAYQDLYQKKLPRTTRSQVKLGKKIAKRKLRKGDLVFFKTGWRQRHVGIYLEDGLFMHASTSRGVMTSSLDNSYWKRKYWQSRRVL